MLPSIKRPVPKEVFNSKDW